MVGSIREWLAALDLEHLTPLFEEGQVGLRDLSLLDENDLSELGLPLGPRKRVLSAIAALKSNEVGSNSRIQEPDDYARTDVERRQLTLMFCDLVGSTELSHRLDPEDLRDVMRSYQDVVTAAVTRYGGHVAKYLGDGLLVYFGWPLAYEDQAERAVRAGLDTVVAVTRLEVDDEATLQARVGIATGQVVVGDLVGETGRDPEAVTGDTPNLAARLQQVAKPGQVVVGAVTRDLIGTSFELHELDVQDLKGFAEPMPAWKVVSAPAGDARFEARVRRLTRFVGREHELGLLIDRWEQSKAGEGQVVLLTGEAGIGKSRLLGALSDRLGQEPSMTLRYQCSPYGVGTALYPIVQHYLRAARIEPSDEDETKIDKLEALLALSSIDVSTTAPILARLLSLPSEARYGALSLTPEQRKERTLDTLLDHLTALAEPGPVLMLFEDAHWIDPTTQELLEATASLIVDRPVMLVIAHRPEWQTSFHGAFHTTPLVLNRLGRARTDEMVKAAGGDGLADPVIEQIVSRTDGIPLFVEELTKSVLEAGTVGFEIPETLQASLLARLDRLGPAKHLAQVGAVIGRDFDHKLLLALIGGGESELQPLIDHLVASGLVYKQGRSPNVHYVFKHALVQEEAYESLLKSRRRELHGDIARALLAQTPKQAALLAYHWERAEDLEQAFACRVKAAEQAFALHAQWEAVAQYWSALELLDRLPDTPEIRLRHVATVCAIIHVRASIFWQNNEERRLALRHLDQAIRTAAGKKDFASLAQLEAFKGDHWPDEALLAQAVKHADASGDKATQAEVASRYSGYLGQKGRFEDSYSHAGRAIEIYGQLGENVRQGLAMAGEGRCFSARAGRLEVSLRYASRAREIAETTGDLHLKAWLAMESEPYMYKGLWEETVRVAEEGLPAAWEIGDWFVVLFTSAWAAIACVKLGRLDDARRFLDEALTGFGQRAGFDYPQAYFRMALGQVQLASGKIERALMTALSATELAERGGYLLEQGAAYRTLGEVYEANVDRPEAEAAFRRSLEILGNIQSRPELAQSLLAYGRFLMKTNAEDSREQLERALALFEQLDATGWIEETHAALVAA